MTRAGLDGPALGPARAQRRASDPQASSWVAASAGTGKTKVLTDRVLRLMLDGTPPDKILCITFTRAAAAEMANRLNHTLARWATMADGDLAATLHDLTGRRPDTDLQLAARRLFAGVLDAPGGMKIQTIHGFCQSLLRRFPLEAGLSPHFRPIDERDARTLLDEVVHAVLSSPSRPVAEAVQTIAAQVDEGAFAELMSELTQERGRLARLLARFGGLAGLQRAIRDHLGVADAPSEADVVAEACTDAAADAPALRRAAQALASGSEAECRRAAAIAAWLEDPPRRAAGLEAYAQAFLTQAGTPRQRLISRATEAANPGAAVALEAEATRLAALWARRKAVTVAAASAALFTVGAAIVDAYQEARRSGHLLDYDDLVLRSAALLRRPGIAPWVLFKLDGGIDHILVDEAQDTSPEQWQVVAALAEEFFAGAGAREQTRTIFAVGDEKQSIFSFQGADPVAFARMRAHFAERVDAVQGAWRPVDLNTSFRSTGAVLRLVDAVFADAAVREGVVAEPAATVRHDVFRRGDGGSVELWPQTGPLPAEEATAPWSPPLEQARAPEPAATLARHIAETIRGWLDRGEPLEAKGRPIHPGDIMVLVRRRNRFFEALVRALKDCGVPVAGVDRMVLDRQLAVMDLLALADFLLLPDDDLSLATVLKTPVIGLSEEHLFAIAYDRPGRLWDALAAGARGDARLGAAYGYLAGLLDQVDFLSPYALFGRVLASPCPADPVSGRRALLARLGPEAEDALDELLSQALAYEGAYAPSLQGFVRWLRLGRAEVKRELDQGEQRRVRIMTVHGAKGLQAPVVILPDTLSKPLQSPRILWPDEAMDVPLWAPRRELEEARCAAARQRANRRRDQEYRRLLYVALTRAEDRLVICGYHGRKAPPEDCWYALCTAALSGLADCRGEPGGPGGGTIRRLTTPQTAAARSEPTPAALWPTVPLPPWVRAPAPAEPEPARPLVPSRPLGAEPAVRSPLAADDGDRFRRGTLIHALLQRLPDVEPGRRTAVARRYLAQPMHALTRAQQEDIAGAVMGVLDTPDFAPLFGPGSRAEVPVAGLVGGQALSGQIDRLLVEEDAVLVLDYKTHRPPPPTPSDVPPIYLRQMAAYREALRRIYPDRPARCALLWTDGPRLMRLDDALLDLHAP